MPQRAEDILSYSVPELVELLYERCEIIGMDRSDVDMYAISGMMWMNWWEMGAEWFVDGMKILTWDEEMKQFEFPVNAHIKSYENDRDKSEPESSGLLRSHSAFSASEQL